MKKLSLLLAVIMLLSVMAGCKKKDEPTGPMPDAADPSLSESSSEPASESAAPNDNLTYASREMGFGFRMPDDWIIQSGNPMQIAGIQYSCEFLCAKADNTCAVMILSATLTDAELAEFQARSPESVSDDAFEVTLAGRNFVGQLLTTEETGTALTFSGVDNSSSPVPLLLVFTLDPADMDSVLALFEAL